MAIIDGMDDFWWRIEFLVECRRDVVVRLTLPVEMSPVQAILPPCQRELSVHSITQD